jgi:hypothetical protein
MGGHRLKVFPGQPHELHAGGHMQFIGSEAQKTKQRNYDAKSLDVTFRATLEHLALHVDMLAKNPLQVALYQTAFRSFKELVKLGKQIQADAQKQMKAEANQVRQQQQQQGQEMDRVVAARVAQAQIDAQGDLEETRVRSAGQQQAKREKNAGDVQIKRERMNQEMEIKRQKELQSANTEA